MKHCRRQREKRFSFSFFRQAFTSSWRRFERLYRPMEDYIVIRYSLLAGSLPTEEFRNLRFLKDFLALPRPVARTPSSAYGTAYLEIERSV
jgi:hypothetical protein